MNRPFLFAILISTGFILNTCSDKKTETNTDTTAANQTKKTFSITNLVNEEKMVPDSAIAGLNAQHQRLA